MISDREMDLLGKLWLLDEKSFELVFKTYYEPLAAFAYRYVEDFSIAEELVQDVFYNIWQKADTVKIRTSPKSYLYGAVRNHCLNYLKHLKVERAYVEHEKGLISSTDYNSELEFDELQHHIDRAIDKLPPKCKEIFLMNRQEGKRYKEISDELSISLKTVENQMGKALKVLKIELAEFLPLIFIWTIMIFIFLEDGSRGSS